MPREPWPEDARRCPRCGRPLPGSVYGATVVAGIGGPIALIPTREELIGRCLVDGPTGRRAVPESHDRAWILHEARSLSDALRADVQYRWERLIDEGIRQAEAGSFDYLGHALFTLNRSGPRRRNRERIDELLVALGHQW